MGQEAGQNGPLPPQALGLAPELDAVVPTRPGTRGPPLPGTAGDPDWQTTSAATVAATPVAATVAVAAMATATATAAQTGEQVLVGGMAAGLSAPGRRRRHQSGCLGPKGIVLAGGEKTGPLGLSQQSQDGPEGAARNARDEEGWIEVDGHGWVGEHGLEGALARSALGDDDGTEPPPRRRRGSRCHAPVRVGVGVGVVRLWDGMGCSR